MTVIQLPVGQLQANCYLLGDVASKQTVIIDPGDDADLITDRVRDEGLTPLAVLLTHGHFDHIMAASDIQLTYNIPVYLHSQDQFLLDRLPETVMHFLGWNTAPLPPKPVVYYDLETTGRIKSLKERSHLTTGPFSFQIIEIPGHTRGSVGLYLSTSKVIFVGDVLFAQGGYGRTDFSYSNQEDLMKSIQTLMKLPDDTLVYSGHGEPTTIGKEKKLWQDRL